MLTIPQALRRIKGNLTAHVPQTLVHQICRDLDDSFRQRSLTPVVTTYLFLQQILHGNPAAGELRHLSGLDFTDAASCQARARLPLAFFRRLQRAVTGDCRATDQLDSPARWRGHRLYGLDGSSFAMPDTPELQEAFGQPGAQAPGGGFPTAHLLVLFDAYAGVLLQALPAPLRTHDLSRAVVRHRLLEPGDLLLGDRAFCSYAHLALLRQRKLHGLFRAHQKLIIDFRPRRRHVHPKQAKPAAAGRPRSRWRKRLGKRDPLVEYFKPQQRPRWMTAAEYAQLPESLVVRELRFRVAIPGRRGREVTVVTTLVDPRRYKARALAKLYAQRWQAETKLKHLKQTLGLDVLRCETVPGGVKELLLFVVVYNLVCRVIQEAAARQGVVPDRISFVDALRWLRYARAGDELPRLRVNPERPGRVELRVRKRRPKPYDLMRKPRAELRNALLGKNCAA
jgi:Transposase DDE domain